MTANEPTGVTPTLESLRTLAAAARDCAARETRLTQEGQTRTSAERQRRDKALAALEAETAADLEAAQAAHLAARARLEQSAQRRQDRLTEAVKSSRKKALETIEREEGTRKYELQKNTMQSERDRKAAHAAADATYAEYKTRLLEQEQALSQLEEGARQAFSGGWNFHRLMAAPAEAAPALPPDEHQGLLQLQAALGEAGAALAAFRPRLLPRFFALIPVWLPALFLVVGGIVAAAMLQGNSALTPRHVALASAGLLALLGGLFGFCLHQSRPAAAAIARALRHARHLRDICQAQAETRHARELELAQAAFDQRAKSCNQHWAAAVDAAAAARQTMPGRMDAKKARVAARHETLARLRLERLDRAHAADLERRQRARAGRADQIQRGCDERVARITAEGQGHLEALAAEWQQLVQPAHAAFQRLRQYAEAAFPAWNHPGWAQWEPPSTFARAARFGQLEIDFLRLVGNLPPDTRLAWPGPARFPLPLLLTFPQEGSLLLETAKHGRDEAISALNNILHRLLAVAPPGRLSLTLIDPVGLGQNFSGIMHLADYEEALINSRIWTQPTQIEQRLADLSEHMEKVIQRYLRNEYATLAEYNERAGTIAEKYHLLVFADFPANLSEGAARRLLNIASSGARCGVHTLIHWDHRQPPPHDFIPDELRKHSVALAWKDQRFLLAGEPAGAMLALDPPPAPDVSTAFLHRVGQRSKDSNRVQVPFVQVAPAPEALWTGDTTTQLQVAIGRTGATKLQQLEFGKGTCQHGLVAGKTGSGKSTLFHVLVTNLALWCDPTQVEFYLVDFKKGVEFKCYATHRLPHARVVAIESDRDFGLSVLQRVDDELKRRGDLFRRLGVQDIPGYKKAGGSQPMPRTLLLIDEFQELFVEDDKVAQTASMLLDRIVRQGRAFGIHVLLGSQTLGGAYTLARATMGQMVVRIALQCNETDASLIMDENNPAPRLLSRPGEGLYNDAAGALEGNSPFQVVWLPDDERDVWLEKVRARADQTPGTWPGPIVFEGNAPSHVDDNAELAALLAAPAPKPSLAPRFWLGAPNSIKGPTEAIFHRQSGSHLLIVGQREESALAMLTLGLVALSAQHPRGGARFLLLDVTPPGTSQRDLLERLAASLPHDLALVRPADLPRVLGDLSAEMKRRADNDQTGGVPPVFLFVHNLHKLPKLRFEEDYGFSSGDAGDAPSPGASFNAIISDGARSGIHIVATCDTAANATRCLGRKALGEFGQRVLFQMSANDSAALMDNPAASNLGLHRAIYYHEQESRLEVFRPYALPDNAWFEQAARQIAQLPG